MNKLEKCKSNWLRRQWGIFTPQEIAEENRQAEVKQQREALEATKGMPLFNE